MPGRGWWKSPEYGSKATTWLEAFRKKGGAGPYNLR